MSTVRTRVTTGLRLTVAVIVIAAATIVTIVAVAAGLPGHRSQTVSTDVSPPAASSVLACDGPLLALGRDASSGGEVSVAADQNVTLGSAAKAKTAQTTLKSPDVAGGGGPQSLVTPPSGRTAAIVGAAGSATVAAADLRGYTASACHPALMQSWLVGGSAGTGSTDLVLLANPAAVAATVQITVYGPDGAQTPPGGADVIVPARSQRVLPLAGLALGADSPVLKVVSSGAPVQASLQTSIIRTLVPGGVDQVSAVSTAARSQTIPGVRVRASAGSSSSPLTVLRVLAPGASARAAVTVRDSAGHTALKRSVPLTRGEPIEVALNGLRTGTYSVQVASAAAVVTGVWNATGAGRGDDFAWNAAAPAIRTTATVAVPAGSGPVLSVTNSGAHAATFTIKPVTGGRTRTKTIPAGQSGDVSVVAGYTYALTPRSGAQIEAAVSFASSGALAAFPVWPTDAAAPELTVYP